MGDEKRQSLFSERDVSRTLRIDRLRKAIRAAAAVECERPNPLAVYLVQEAKSRKCDVVDLLIKWFQYDMARPSGRPPKSVDQDETRPGK